MLHDKIFSTKMVAKMARHMNTKFTCDENYVCQLITNPVSNFLTFRINVIVFMKLT